MPPNLPFYIKVKLNAYLTRTNIKVWRVSLTPRFSTLWVWIEVTVELLKIHSHWGPTPDLPNQVSDSDIWACVIFRSVKKKKPTPKPSWLLRNLLKGTWFGNSVWLPSRIQTELFFFFILPGKEPIVGTDCLILMEHMPKGHISTKWKLFADYVCFNLFH